MKLNLNDMPLKGIGNKKYHQRIISDLIFAIRKNFAKKRIKGMEVLPEISISSLECYEYAQCGTVVKDYNFDIAIIDNDDNLLMIIEVEGGKRNKTEINKKLEDCLKNIDDLQEIMSIEYNKDGDLKFYHYSLQRGKLVKQETTSHCELLNMNFKTSLVSLKK